MLTSIRSLLCGKNQQEVGKAQPAASPSLEMLEPRVLLSADSLPIEPLVQTESPLGTSAVNVDLDKVESNQSDPSAILTYFTSSSETRALAPEGTVSGGAEESEPNNDFLGEVTQPAFADSLLTPALENVDTLSQMPLSQTQPGIQVYVEPEKPSTQVQNALPSTKQHGGGEPTYRNDSRDTQHYRSGRRHLHVQLGRGHGQYGQRFLRDQRQPSAGGGLVQL